MFRLLNALYSDVWLSYTLYDIIKTEIVNHNVGENHNVEKNHNVGENHNVEKNHNVEEKNKAENILAYLNNLVLKDVPVVFDVKDDYVVIDVEDKDEVNVEKFTVKNQAFQLNFLRSDMISWKKSKLNYTYAEEEDWEYINDPTNLPCNNYLLYLLENMPENIICNNNNKKDGWKRADEIGFEKEACAILNTVELEEATRENIWIDDRLLGDKWLGLFSSISPYDTYIEMDAPVLQ